MIAPLPEPIFTPTERRCGAGPLVRTWAGSIKRVSVSDMKTFSLADRGPRPSLSLSMTPS